MSAKVKVEEPHSLADISVSLWVRLLESHNLMLAELRRRFVPGRGGAATLPRFDLLANLIREDGLTLAALSRRMLVTAGNVTGLVDRAERDGLVERRADPDDRRSVARVFDEKGDERSSRRCFRVMRRTSKICLRRARFAKERRELRRLLGKLRGSFTSQDSEQAVAS